MNIKTLTSSILRRIQKLLGDAPAQESLKWTCQYLGNSEILLSRAAHRIILPGWDLSLTPWIINSGNWEPALTETIERYCRAGMVALDVGANVGWFTSVMASCGADVHAFEPNPRLETFLRKNVFLNAGARTPHCSVNRCVIGAEAGSVQLRFPHHLVGGAGIHNSDQSQFLDSLMPETIETPMITIDEFVAKRRIPQVHIIKIDVEGYEENVILGARKTIRFAGSLLVPLEYTRGRYSKEFPAILFDLFASILVLPEQKRISLQELINYEQGKFLGDRPLLELICAK